MKDVLIKDESGNPTGSFKARGLAAAVSMAIELGTRELVTPTAGNAGGALAAYAARAGVAAHVYMPADEAAFLAFTRAGRNEGREALCMRLEALARERGDLSWAAANIARRSMCWVARNNHARALAISAEAMAIVEPLPASERKVMVWRNEAWLRMLERDCVESLEWARRALAMADALGLVEQRHTFLHLIACDSAAARQRARPPGDAGRHRRAQEGRTSRRGCRVPAEPGLRRRRDHAFRCGRAGAARGSAHLEKYIGNLRDVLKELSSLLKAKRTFAYQCLTPMEIKMANHIRDGKGNKEIADLLNLSRRTVEVHRLNIRQEIGIGKMKVNLKTYLMTLD